MFDDTLKRVGLEATGLRGAYDAASDAALVADPVRQPGSDEVFYFVMTDRFANGDASNDEGGLTGDRLTTGSTRPTRASTTAATSRACAMQLDYIDGLGTTAIWLTPSFKNRPVQGEGANASAGYHGYWITDFTQIDPHLGTNAELEALIADAHDTRHQGLLRHHHEPHRRRHRLREGQYSYIDQATEPVPRRRRRRVRPGRLRRARDPSPRSTRRRASPTRRR